jgi:hypothetical protein
VSLCLFLSFCVCVCVFSDSFLCFCLLRERAGPSWRSSSLPWGCTWSRAASCLCPPPLLPPPQQQCQQQHQCQQQERRQCQEACEAAGGPCCCCWGAGPALWRSLPRGWSRWTPPCMDSCEYPLFLPFSLSLPHTHCCYHCYCYYHCCYFCYCYCHCFANYICFSLSVHSYAT